MTFGLKHWQDDAEWRTHHRWPDPLEGPWYVELVFQRIDDRMECVGVAVRHGTDDEPVNSTVLRQLSLGTLIQEERKKRVDYENIVLDEDAEWTVEPDEDRKRLASDQASSFSRGRYSIEHYEQVAAVYREAYRKGLPAPTKEVQRVLGAKTRRTAAGWVQRARELGLLPPTEKRKPKA